MTRRQLNKLRTYGFKIKDQYNYTYTYLKENGGSQLLEQEHWK